MNVNAHFVNIKKYIKLELKKSTESIYVAVAWFTDRSLFKLLCDKANEGVEVHLMIMDDDITRNCSLNYSKIEDSGGSLYLINDSFGTLMHNKFCVIDGQNVITGSYNWSIKAASNYENITITEDAPSLAFTFINEFKRIKETFHGVDRTKPLDISIVIKRFQIIDSLIVLEEYQDIISHLFKLKEFTLTSELKTIIELLEDKHWFQAQSRINYFIQNRQAITSYDRLKIEELKWKIQYLEIEILSLETEKNVILKIIGDFIHEYNIRFGQYLIEILNLKAEKIKSDGTDNSKSYKEAKENYERFKDDFEREVEKEKNKTNLSSDEQDQLKRAYKKAARLCHPDMILSKHGDNSELREKASEVFKKLNDANEHNDLRTVLEILRNLENDVFDFILNDATPANKLEDLQRVYDVLSLKLEILVQEVSELNNDKTYQQVTNIYNLDDFFNNEEQKLKAELEKLKK